MGPEGSQARPVSPGDLLHHINLQHDLLHCHFLSRHEMIEVFEHCPRPNHDDPLIFNFIRLTDQGWMWSVADMSFRWILILSSSCYVQSISHAFHLKKLLVIHNICKLHNAIIFKSSVILNAKKNPNFSSTVKYLDIELPEQVRPILVSNLD